MEEKGDPESQNYMVSTIQPLDGTPRFQTVLQFLPRHSCSRISGHRGLCVVGVIIHSRGRSRDLKVSATLKIAIFPYLRFPRFQIDMLERFLLKKKSEENIISVERYRG